MASDTGLKPPFRPPNRAARCEAGVSLSPRSGALALAGLPAWPTRAQAPAAPTLRAAVLAAVLGGATASALPTPEPAFPAPSAAAGTLRRPSERASRLPIVPPAGMIGAPEMVALSASAHPPCPPGADALHSLPPARAGTLLLPTCVSVKRRAAGRGFRGGGARDRGRPTAMRLLLIEEWRARQGRRPDTGNGGRGCGRELHRQPASADRLSVSSRPGAAAAPGECEPAGDRGAEGRGPSGQRHRHGRPALRTLSRARRRSDARARRAHGRSVDARNAADSTSSILLHDGRATRPIARIVYDREPSRAARHCTSRIRCRRTACRTRIDLQQRAASQIVAFDGIAGEWLAPVTVALGAAAFESSAAAPWCSRWRTAPRRPAVFHLHGHHAGCSTGSTTAGSPSGSTRVTVAGGQTDRVAFLADNPGTWLIEAQAGQWKAAAHCGAGSRSSLVSDDRSCR